MQRILDPNSTEYAERTNSQAKEFWEQRSARLARNKERNEYYMWLQDLQYWGQQSGHCTRVCRAIEQDRIRYYELVSSNPLDKESIEDMEWDMRSRYGDLLKDDERTLRDVLYVRGKATKLINRGHVGYYYALDRS
jgi:hypothetical protein